MKWIIVFAILVGGCAWKDYAVLKCRTETKIKRVCDSEGSGKEIVISPDADRALGE